MVAVWESVASLRPPRITDSEVRALAAVVREQHQAGELIAVAPAWLSPLIQRELGDLMPVEQLARPDGKRFARISEVSLPPFHSVDVTGLTSLDERWFGPLRLKRYQQTPVTVSFDFTEHFLDATVSQLALSSPTGERPCLWTGSLPGTTPHSAAIGGFGCGATRVERRTMEVDYQPRRGIVTEIDSGQNTLLRFSVPEVAWQGSALHLWLGLHDYHQRKQAQGPVAVVVDFDDGQVRLPLMVQVGQGFVHHQLELPKGSGEVHHVRFELSAANAPHHFLALHGELRR